MKIIKIIAILIVAVFYSNTYCATKPPAEIKDKLTTLKQSLGSLKTKLNTLHSNLERLKKQLSKESAAESLFSQQSGTSGSWVPLNTRAYGEIGIKIFHETNVTKEADLAIEFYTWEHIQKIHQLVIGKNKIPEEWAKAPCTEFLYSSKFFGSYHDENINSSLILINVEKELKEKTPPIDLSNKIYLIMDNFASDCSFRKKVSADGWKNDIEEFILTKMNNKLPADETQQASYLNKLVLKIGYILLLLYYMGVTVEDCDMFIIFNPEFNRRQDFNPQTFTNKTAAIDDYIRATRIKLVDFGESRIFYRNDGKNIIPVDDTWYKSADKENCIKIVIQNKNQAIIQLAKSFGGSIPSDSVTAYLGDMNDKFKNSFKLLNEFPAIKPQVKAKFEELKKIFGTLNYDTEIDKIL